MTFQNPFLGPFAPIGWPSLPDNVVTTEPVSDNNIDIGTSTKRYRTLWATDVHTTSVEATTVTAGTISATTLNGMSVANITTSTGGPFTTGNILVATAPNMVEDSGLPESDIVTVSGAPFVTGHLVQAGSLNTVNDSSIPTTEVVRYIFGSPMTNNNLVAATGSGNGITDVAVDWRNVITDTANLVSGNLVSGSGNKTVADSAVVAANVVTNTGTQTSTNIALFGTGKTITDSGANLSQYVARSGSTMTGDLDMNTHNITNAPNLVSLMFSLSPVIPTTIVNTTTAGTLLGPGFGSLVVPANSTVEGTAFDMKGLTFTTMLNAAVLTLTLRINGGIVVATNSYTNSGGTLNILLSSSIRLEVANSTFASIRWTLDTNYAYVAPVVVWISNWDKTISHTFDLYAVWSVASPSNSCTQTGFTVTRTL